MSEVDTPTHGRRAELRADSRRGNDALEPINAVWPPPPCGVASLATWFPYRFLNLRLNGATPDFRGGWIGIEPTDITIHAKMVHRSSGLMLFCLLNGIRGWLPRPIWYSLLGAFIIYILLLYLLRKPMTLTVPWHNVRQLVLDKEKHRACIDYDVPDQGGKVKTYSLVFALNEALYPSLVNAAELYAPGRSHADKLRGESMIWLLVPVLNILVVLFATLLLFNLFMGHY